jgi:flagellin
MALEVMNNISALYAENNLTNTQNALQNTLQQLSSGTTLNSGANNPAGLSLADGLGANSAALTQSATNASEGVGLLQVADGALSQVNSLLTSAVTLATEASNGTLNTSQDAAAQQEYQSILSEINNIGSTTTYNSQQVFATTGNGTATQIYTGDSSSAGASIDNLTFSALNSTSVGTTGGTIAQSGTTSAGLFYDLSTTGQNAATTDTVTGGLILTATTAGGSTSTFTTTATTVAALIQQINGAGIAGVSASFTTAGAVGDAGAAAATNTGIEISAGAGVTLTSASATVALKDTPTGVAPAVAGVATTSSGIATISETGETGGANLQATNLLTAGGAQAALTALNAAVSDVASQRGYLGSQINTLNSVSSVETTMQENLTSAQTAISATNYGSATTAMSSEEVLSQTGISALAQANSTQQEVLKLLQ